MKFLAGMFRQRKPVPPAEPPREEVLPVEALARLARERAEAEREAEQRQAGIDEIRQACEGPARYWWPGEAPLEGRLSARPSFAGRAADAVRAFFEAMR